MRIEGIGPAPCWATVNENDQRHTRAFLEIMRLEKLCFNLQPIETLIFKHLRLNESELAELFVEVRHLRKMAARVADPEFARTLRRLPDEREHSRSEERRVGEEGRY